MQLVTVPQSHEMKVLVYDNGHKRTLTQSILVEQVKKSLVFVRQLKQDMVLFQRVQEKQGSGYKETTPGIQFYRRFLQEASARVQNMPGDANISLDNALRRALLKRAPLCIYITARE